MTRNAFPFYESAVEEIGASLKNSDGRLAEATVYDLLRKQLPSEWSFVWGVQLGIHEYDFLVLVPGRGIVNVECKGHGYKPVGATGMFSWYNRDLQKEEPRDVIGQAARAKNSYIHHLQVALFGEGRQWGVMGFCVVFPLDEFAGINFRGSPVFRKSDCDADGGMERIVLSALDKAEYLLRERGVRNPVRLVESDASRIWAYWTQTMTGEILSETARPLDLSSYSRRLENLLSVSQEAALSVILRPTSSRVLVEGSAGSGKTFLGLAIAAQAKGRVLYVCFNKVLACHVAQTLPPDPRLTITNFHRLSVVLFGHPLEIPKIAGESESDFWRRFDEELWERLKGMAPGEYPLYDTIVVDEAQDLTRTQLLILLRCSSTNGRVVLLADSEQVLYENRLSKDALSRMIRGMECFELKHNLRNPRPVKQYCDTFVPSGDDDKILLDGPDVVRRRIPLNSVDDFLSKEVLTRYNPSDIAVLSPELSILKAIGFGLKVPCYGPEGKKVREIEKNLKLWKRNGCVWKSTTHSFKGLEAMAVVHVILPDYPFGNLLYVGGTRATHQLYVIEVV